ncbi:MAG: hypothetical protein R2751_16685 [Bacteroidales bacterium]
MEEPFSPDPGPWTFHYHFVNDADRICFLRSQEHEKKSGIPPSLPDLSEECFPEPNDPPPGFFPECIR